MLGTDSSVALASGWRTGFENCETGQRSIVAVAVFYFGNKDNDRRRHIQLAFLQRRSPD